MRLEPITDYIEQETDLTNGVDLFTHSMPAGASTGVLVVTEGAGNRVDHEIKGIFTGRYQVIVRDKNYGAATQRAYELFNMLDLVEEDLGVYVVTYSRPRHTPIPIGGRSNGDLIELSINFEFRYRMT